MTDPLVAGGLAYREVLPPGEPLGTVVCLHGWPESSFMFGAVLDAAAAAGWRALAPDLPGYGGSEPDAPATWPRMVDAVERFHAALDLGPVALVVHDWGGLIGLRWACDHPASVRALVISDTGFFSDGKWHGLADVLRTPGEGEKLADWMTSDALAGALRAVSCGLTDAALAEYGRAFSTPERRAGQLELYRSGQFEELIPYEGRLSALGVPTLLLWGADDPFAPVAGAHRFAAEIPHAELEVIDGAGHFVYDDDPQRTSASVARFLGTLPAE